MPAIDLYTPVYSALHQLGCNNQVYTVPEETIPCPCTDNPWHQYSSTWHLQHPDAPDCHQTGRLLMDGSEGFFEIETIWGLAIPNFNYRGTEASQTISGLDMTWPWLGITQSPTKFNRWINPVGMTFMVHTEMPYYVGGDGSTLAVAIYGMTQVNRDGKIP